MATHIIQIGKHRFICGLFWQSLSRPRELRKEAAELARKIDSDLMVLRKDHAMAQAGYAHTRDGARRGMFSLAAIVSKTLAIEGAHYDGSQQPVHNWLSAFKLPDGVWAYFAVRDANFLPNGDFAGTKAEVLDRLHGDYGLGGWNVVIGDPELEEHGFHNFCAKQIEDLIPHKKDGQIKAHQWWGLSPIEQNIPWKPIAAAGALATMMGIGGFSYWQHNQQKKEADERARAIEIARQKMLGKAVPVVASHPWPKKPLPQLTAQTCLDRLTLLSPGGWQLDEYACTTTQAAYAWSRGNSTVGYLLAQVPQAVVDISGDKASYSEILELAAGKDEDLLLLKELLQSLHSKLQLLGLALKATNLPSSQQPLPGTDKSEMPKPEWQTISFTVNAGSLPPTEVAAILSQPGIRLDRLAYRVGAWSIEGVIYAK